MTAPSTVGPRYLSASFLLMCVYIEMSKSSIGTTRSSHFFTLKAIWVEFGSFAFPIQNQEHRRGKLINMHCHNILSHSNIGYVIKCINSEHHKYLASPQHEGKWVSFSLSEFGDKLQCNKMYFTGNVWCGAVGLWISYLLTVHSLELLVNLIWANARITN